jgi:hypothetical protein
MSLGEHLENQLTQAPGQTIAKAFIAAQNQMGDAVKGSKNPFFKSSYADLNSIREAVIPVLLKNNIAVLQPTEHINGRNFVKTVLLHSSGETIQSLTEIVVAKQNDPQALGSAISYARRYGLQSLVCIGAVDDDAELAMERQQPAKSVPAASGDLRKDVTAKAGAAVARKLLTVDQLRAVTKTAGTTVYSVLGAVADKDLAKIKTFLEEKLNG